MTVAPSGSATNGENMNLKRHMHSARLETEVSLVSTPKEPVVEAEAPEQMKGDNDPPKDWTRKDKAIILVNSQPVQVTTGATKPENMNKMNPAVGRISGADNELNQVLECKECGKMGCMGGKLKKHVTTHSSAEKCDCTVCAQLFSMQKDLINHMVGEREAENQECDMCSKGFVTDANLTEHRSTHTEARPFECITSGKWFSSKRGLQTHKPKHDIQTKIVTTGHMKMNLGKPKECKVCGKCLEYVGNHIEKSHEEINNACPLCGAAPT